MLPQSFGSKEEFRHFAAQVVRQWIGDLDRGKVQLRIPRSHGLQRTIPGMPFHPWPELFLQVSGITVFEFPDEKFEVSPGEICMVPAGMPHRERVRAGEEAFTNVVFLYGMDHLQVHFAREEAPCIPEAYISSQIFDLDHPHLSDILKDLAEWFHGNDDARSLAVKCVLLDHLFIILKAIEHPIMDDLSGSLKVVQIRQFLTGNLFNPSLSLNWIARSLQCNPDYLTRLFKKTMGVSIVDYIVEQRLRHARHLLVASTLNISEISRSVGYDNPDYFTQVFRRNEGITPRQFRRLRTWKMNA